MEAECIYCEHHDLIIDSNHELRWICTKIESRNFFTEVDCIDSCDEFEPEETDEEN